jgi:hypothetical protein
MQHARIVKRRSSEQRHRRSSFLARCLSVLLAVNMALMFALPLGMFADELPFISVNTDEVIYDYSGYEYVYDGSGNAPVLNGPNGQVDSLPAGPTNTTGNTGSATDGNTGSSSGSADVVYIYPETPTPSLSETLGDSVEPTLMGSGFTTLAVNDWTVTSIASALRSSDTGAIVAIGPDPDIDYYAFNTSNAANDLNSALAAINSGSGVGAWVLYMGKDAAANSTAVAAFGAIANSKATTLIITGDPTDPLPATPTPATSDPGKNLTGLSSVNFYTNVEFRNVYFDATNVYMNGYDLLLGNRAWAAGTTSFYGGAASGNITAAGDGTVSMTVYSTGTGTKNFYGGMKAGTLTGNTAVTIHNTSGATLNVYGAGEGTTSNPANLIGNATTTIDGMGTSAGGLDRFVGGVYAGNIDGKIVNRISGLGRWSASLDSNSWSANGFLGGSYNGDIGKDEYKPGYSGNSGTYPSAYKTDSNSGVTVIDTDIDTSAWTSGDGYIVGGNWSAGTVKGNIVTVAKAGTNDKGAFDAFSGGSAERLDGSWNDAFGWDTTNHKITGAEAARAAAESYAGANGFKLYGNITNIIKSGCISTIVPEDGYFRGAGWGGYIQGNVVSNVGTEGLCWRNDYAGGNKDALDGGDITSLYIVSTTQSQAKQGVETDFDLVGGGGSDDGGGSGSSLGSDDIMIVGDTTLRQENVRARWTYGGSFGGCQIGDTKNILVKGIVDTLEGSGYWAYMHVGDSYSIVEGGQVDWFFSGGGWTDTYQDGDAHVEVHDNPRLDKNGNPIRDTVDFDGDGDTSETAPAAIINASMGGTFGCYETHYISGDSYVTVKGGDFRGIAGSSIGQEGSNVLRGFSAGPSNRGFIYGNTTTTMDLRGNQYGFAIEAGDSISGARRLGAANYSHTGTNANNVITLNIFADPTADPNILNGLNIYGDASSGASTTAGHVIININAPGAIVGTVIATNYSNISGGQIAKDVEMNLVSVGTLRGLTSMGMWGTSNADDLTNAVVTASRNGNGNEAVLNVGPQIMENSPFTGGLEAYTKLDGSYYSKYYNPDVVGGAANMPDFLYSWESDTQTSGSMAGYASTVHIGTQTSDVGVINFTELNVNRRILMADQGSILNGKGATAANHGSTYSNFGDIELHSADPDKPNDGAAIGVASSAATSGIISAGKIEAGGGGDSFVFSPGGKNKVVLTDYSVDESTGNAIVWIRYPDGQPEVTFDQPTDWFGETRGYQILTFNPDKSKATNVTPANFRGRSLTDSKTYIGDNFVEASGTGNGYGVCVPGSFFTFDVVAGDDGISLGKIRSNVTGATLVKPASGHISVYGSYTGMTWVDHGYFAVPATRIPAQVVNGDYPTFWFKPDADKGEWVKLLSIDRSDGANYDVAEQPIEDYSQLNTYDPDAADYDPAISPTQKWAMTAADVGFSFDMDVDYTSVDEIYADSILLHEREAQALVLNNVTALPADNDPDDDTPKTDAEVIANIIAAQDAKGRPFFTNNINVAEARTKLGTPLDEANDEEYRIYSVTYQTHETNGGAVGLTRTATITVLPNDALIDGNKSIYIYAHDATLRTAQAKATDTRAKVDAWTGAKIISVTIPDDDPDTPANESENPVIVDPDTSVTLNLTDEANKVNTIKAGAATGNTPISLSYTATAGTESMSKTVAINIITGAKPVIDATPHRSADDPDTTDVDESTLPGPLEIWIGKPADKPSYTYNPVDTNSDGYLDVSQLLGADSASDGNTVTATDTEDPAISGVALPAVIVDTDGDGVADAVNIPYNKRGVYTVYYSVADSDGNVGTQKRALIVNDGSIVHDDYYIMDAGSFIINIDEVDDSNPPTSLNNQVLTKSNAQVWDIEGQPTATAPKVNHLGTPYSYQASTDPDNNDDPDPEYYDYQPNIGVTDSKSSLNTNITARVTTEKAGNGEVYSITAHDIKLSPTKAAALKAKKASNATGYVSDLVSQSGADAWRHTGPVLTHEGTPTLADNGDTAFQAATSYTVGQTYPITFWVSEDHTATVTINISIDMQSPPVLQVPKLKQIRLNDSFPTGAYADTTPSYMQGVIAHDTEDDAAGTTIPIIFGTLNVGADGVEGGGDDSVTAGTPVNTAVAGPVTVYYQATDSDGNVIIAKGTVLVNDGTWVVDGDYMVHANDFIRLDTQVATEGTGDAAIRTASGALAYVILDDGGTQAVQAVVKSKGTPPNDYQAYADPVAGYSDYAIQFGVIAEAPYSGNPLIDINAKVLDRDVLNQTPSTDGVRYAVAANTPILVTRAWAQAHGGSSLTATQKSELIAAAAAVAYKIDPEATPKTNSYTVDILDNGIPASPAVNSSYTVKFIPTGQNSLPVEVVFTTNNGNVPTLEFTTVPLVIAQTPNESHVLTQAQLNAGVTVEDIEDDLAGRPVSLVATPLSPTGAEVTVDSKNIGITRVRYVATDSDGNTATSYRAVVIDDGRYVYKDENADGKNDIIIGARNFVVKQADVQANEGAIKGLSYAEAFKCVTNDDNDNMVVAVSLAGTPPIPAGYTTGTAAAGDYPFKWSAAGYTATKDISGKVVVADVVNPGTKDSQYAIYASHFQVNTTEAADVIANDSFVTEANAHVVKLVTAAPDRGVAIHDRGGFSTAANTYPIVFNIDGIDWTIQSVTINGVVSDGNMPELNVPTPIIVWIGPAEKKPAGSNVIDPAQYSIKYAVTVSDVEDGAAMTLDRVTATANGPAVDTTKVDIYKVDFSVTDNDFNTVNKHRVVTVDDGRFEYGAGRILSAKAFVIQSDSVRTATTSSQLDDQLRAKTWVRLYNNETGAALPVDQVSIYDTGGYSPTPAVYDITTRGIDNPATNPEIERVVKAEVVDTQVLVADQEGDPMLDTYYIFGNHISLTPPEATAIQNAANPDAALIAALSAGSRKTNPDGTLSTLTVKISDDDGFWARSAAGTGNYFVEVTDSGENVFATLEVTVSAGTAPVLTVTPKPLVFNITSTAGNLTEAQLMQGVSATDAEDDAAGIALTPSIQGGTPSIPANVAGVTKVTYTVTDSAGNTVTDSRAIIVNDGTFVWNDRYILRAKSFIIGKSEVSANDKAGQLKERSAAAAWRVNGDALPTSAIAVISDGGYVATVGVYPIRLGLSDDPSLIRNIGAKVYDDSTKDGTNGDYYSIIANDFYINVPDANTLAAQGTAAIEQKFIEKAGVESYKRSSDMTFQEGTRKLSDDGGFKAAADARALVEGDDFSVTFWVDEDHTAAVTVICHVSNRTPPVLHVPKTRSVAKDAVLTAADYWTGVSYSDNEDTPDQLTATHTPTTINTAVEGPVLVMYSVTDTDHNTTSAGTVFLVGDGYVVGENYIIRAHDFEKDFADVTGTDAEIIAAAEAEAWKMEKDDDGNVIGLTPGVSVSVKANGGYAKALGVYDITLAPTPELATEIGIVGTVVGDGNPPVITFTQYPLKKAQTPGVSHVLTDTELKEGVVVTDAEDDAAGNPVQLTATPLTPAGEATTVDTQNIGVTRVRYVATDSMGNSATAYRAVVIDDGRYIIADENNDGTSDIIIGARNFVVKQEDVQANEEAIKGLSYAEAFRPDGTPLTVSLVSIPDGYITGAAEPGNYDFTWKVTGYTTAKSIVGLVVVADEVDPGTKDSQYAIYASHFQVNTVDAAQVIANDSFVTVADAHVVKLVAAAQDRSVQINDRGGFAAAAGIYPIVFNIQGIPVVTQSVTINGTVSNGGTPELTVPTPLEVWIGPAADIPAGAITAAQYSDTYNVTVSDDKDNLTIADVVISGDSVNTAKVGLYKKHYQVTDSDHNTVSKDRVVVVNDGSYVLGSGRILYASGFVIRASDVTTDSALIDTQLLNKTAAKLYDAATGAAASSDQIRISDRGGYTNAAGSYQVTVAGKDKPATLPEITKQVTAEVVDAEIIANTPPEEGQTTYYIFGNDISLTPVEATAIQAAADPEAALLNALGAGARATNPDGTLTELDVVFNDDDGFFARGATDTRIYSVEIADADDNVSTTLKVAVAAGSPPQLTVTPKPLVFEISSTAGNLTEAQLMQGVIASDVEDDAAGVALNPSIQGGTPSIPANAASVTKVTYTVTDSAGNTVTDSRAVVVNDGTFVYNERYVLQAKSFIIGKSEVSANDKPGQIKQRSAAAAWRVNGDALPTSAIAVISDGGYVATVGVYPIRLGLSDDPSLIRNIGAKVYDDNTKEGTNGDYYSIIASDFYINVPDANALASQGAAAIEQKFIEKSGVESYKRSGDMTFQQGTKKLSSDGGFKAAADSRPLVEGDDFSVTFWVDEDHTAAVTVICHVSNRTPPVLNVPAYRQVEIGATFGEAQFWEGVTYSDNEDTPEQLAPSLTHSPATISTAETAYFVVTYSVTDTDHNTTTKKGVILVGDWLVDEYGITAHDFDKDYNDVTGTDAEILAASEAQAVDLRLFLADGVTENPDFGKAVGVTVADNGGYRKAPGHYEVTLAVTPKPSLTYDILATVTGTGASPVITFLKNPLRVAYTENSHSMTQDELKAEMTVTDAEQGDLLAQTTASPVAGYIDTSAVGAYKVNYAVTDDAGNTTRASRMVVVDDGNWVFGENYMLYAKNFNINLTEVAGYTATSIETLDAGTESGVEVEAAGAGEMTEAEDTGGFEPLSPAGNAQILERSQAKAYDYDGNPAAVTVPDDGGYRAAPGNYSPKVAVTLEPATVKTLSVNVIDNVPAPTEPTPPTIINVYPPNVTVNPPTVNVTVPRSTVSVTTTDSGQPIIINNTQPATTEIPAEETPLAAPEEEETGWSLFNVIATIALLLFTLLLVFKYLKDRSDDDEDEYFGTWDYNKYYYVNLPVLLISVVALIEAIVVLLITQDFAGEMLILDSYSLVFLLALFVAIIAPLVAAATRRIYQQRQNELIYVQAGLPVPTAQVAPAPATVPTAAPTVTAANSANTSKLNQQPPPPDPRTQR